MTSEHEPGAAPDPVVPPVPPAPPAPPAPVSQQPYQQQVIPPQRIYQQPTHPQQPAYTPQPPYSQPPQQPYAPQPPYVQQQPYGHAGYPASVAAPPPASSNRTGLILGIVGGAVALLLVGIGAVVLLSGSGLGFRPGEVPPPPAPLPTYTEQPQVVPSEEPAEDEPIDDDAGADIALRLEAKMDEYKRLRDSGELWQIIPDNEFNRTAVSAFLYMIADMKAATIWGIDAATAKEYDERMAMLEERLLAQQPLGTDVTLSFEDGRVFTYDGDTGEGGYTG